MRVSVFLCVFVCFHEVLAQTRSTEEKEGKGGEQRAFCPTKYLHVENRLGMIPSVLPAPHEQRPRPGACHKIRSLAFCFPLCEHLLHRRTSENRDQHAYKRVQSCTPNSSQIHIHVCVCKCAGVGECVYAIHKRGASVRKAAHLVRVALKFVVVRELVLCPRKDWRIVELFDSPAPGQNVA